MLTVLAPDSFLLLKMGLINKITCCKFEVSYIEKTVISFNGDILNEEKKKDFSDEKFFQKSCANKGKPFNGRQVCCLPRFLLLREVTVLEQFKKFILHL